MIVRSLIITFILLNGLAILAQENAPPSEDTGSTDVSDAREAANRMLEKGHFASAAKIFATVVEANPVDANAHFKLGLCYRNSLDHRKDALLHFKIASESISEDYRFNDPDERSAPRDVLFFLGESYLTNDQPDSALEQFIIYQSSFEEDPPISVDRQILMCINAKRLKKTVRDVQFNELKLINSPYAESHPVVTLDNNLMFFSSRRPNTDNPEEEKQDRVYGQYDQDIYLSRKEGTQWLEPNLFNLSSDGNEVPLAISKDGLTLYYRSDQKGDQNLYQSTYEGGVWKKGEIIGKGINTIAEESALSISDDGNHLYFVSDRDGGLGGSDVYHLAKKSNGKWGRVENVGKPINSEYNERCVFIHPTGNTLFWSSNGYLGKGMGGYDIYFAERKPDGTWGDPQNVGYPINSTGDDLYYYIAGGGTRFYSKADDENSFDIYEITGGGYEFENLDLGTEIVTLTEEMEVAEILEVEKEVQTEVEVLDLSILDEFDSGEEESVEEIDLSELGEDESSDSNQNMDEDSLMVEDEFDHLDVDSINMERLDSADREALIVLVTEWVEAHAPQQEIKDQMTIQYALNSRGIKSEYHENLNKLAEMLKQNPKMNASIEGHADNTGAWEVSFRISNERAYEVFRFLRSKGVPSNQMVWYGKGSSDPIGDNKSEEGRSRNRRTVVFLSE